MMHEEVICNDCGCLLPINKKMREKFPHKCWVILTGYLPPRELPDSDNPHDDPFYEWPEPT